MHDNEFKRNGCGYIDPTAGKALENITEQEKRVSKVVKTMKAVAHLAGFEIEERIVLRDKASGTIWK